MKHVLSVTVIFSLFIIFFSLNNLSAKKSKDLWPPSNFRAVAINEDVYLAWDAPMPPNQVVLQYDDGESEIAMNVSATITGDQYIAVGFTYSEDFSLNALRMLLKRDLETAQDIEYYVYGDNAGIPDQANVLFSGMLNFEPADGSLTWLDFPITGINFSAGEVFYLACRWNPGNDYLVGMDTTDPDAFSFWTVDAGTLWNSLAGTHDAMFRAVIATGTDKAVTYAKTIPYSSDKNGSIGSAVNLPKPDLARHNSKIGRKMIRSFTDKLHTRDLLGYKIFRNGLELAIVGSDIEEVVDTPGAPGTFEYYIIASYDEGVSEPTQTITVTTVEPPIHLFEDNFENLTGWTLTGEFEIGAPIGLGGEHGNPDPASAHSGSNVLGLDLTGLGANPGDYEGGLNNRQHTAESPIIDCSGFMNVTLQFQRYLNIESPTYDHAYIDVWDGTSWFEIYTNTAAESDSEFSLYTYDIPQAADNPEFKIRFSIGETDNSWFYSGWNIDDIVVTYQPWPPVNPVTLVAPVDGATNIANSGYLEWNEHESATEYLVYFGTDNPPSTLVTTTPNLTYNYTDLDFDTQYFWQIVPSNPLGQPPGCPVWTFTTLIDQWGYVTVDTDLIMIDLQGISAPVSRYASLTNTSDSLDANYYARLVLTSPLRKIEKPASVDRDNSESYLSSNNNRRLKSKIASSRDLFDPQFVYDVTTASGVTSQAGVETDGEFIYTTVWNSGDFCKYDMNGIYIETFQVPGASNVRDLAYDGEYFYGADASPVIYKMDFTTQTLVETIYYSGAGTRAIAFDESADAFWVNNWDSDMLLIDRSGNTINAISGIVSTYGAAYDSYTEGGPYLWIHTGTDGAAPLELIQYDIVSGAMTGLSHSDYAAAGGNAGGLFISEGFVPGEVTIGALSQGEAIFGFELGMTSSYGLVSILNPTGEILFGETVQVEISFLHPLPPCHDEVTFDLIYEDELGNCSPDTTSIVILPTGNIDDQNIPLVTTLHQNYPNPFNPVTNIQFYNSIEGKVILSIYNIKGELVKTLLDGNILKGYQNIRFDGAGLNSGVYYYKLETPEKIITKKMILVK